MMRTLKAPPDCNSATVVGQPVEIVDGVCEVEDHIARALQDGHGFVEIAAGSAEDPRPPEEGKEMSGLEVTIAAVGRMERRELFAVAKQSGVALSAKMSTEAMRVALIDFTQRAYAANATKDDPRAEDEKPKTATDVASIGKDAAKDAKAAAAPNADADYLGPAE